MLGSISGIRWKSARVADRSRWKIRTETQSSCSSLLDRSSQRLRWAASALPFHTDVQRNAEPIRELCSVMLDVAKVHELVLQLRHPVMEAAVIPREVHGVHRTVHDAVDDCPVTKCLLLGIRARDEGQRALGIGIAGDAVFVLIVALMLGPWLEGRRVLPQVEMREEQGVISDLPERVRGPGVEPQIVWTQLDGLAERSERLVVLVLEGPGERVNRERRVDRFRDGHVEETPLGSWCAAESASSAARHARTMSPAGSIERMVATLLPACQYSARPAGASESRRSRNPERTVYQLRIQ